MSLSFYKSNSYAFPFLMDLGVEFFFFNFLVLKKLQKYQAVAKIVQRGLMYSSPIFPRGYILCINNYSIISEWKLSVSIMCVFSSMSFYHV